GVPGNVAFGACDPLAPSIGACGPHAPQSAPGPRQADGGMNLGEGALKGLRADTELRPRRPRGAVKLSPRHPCERPTELRPRASGWYLLHPCPYPCGCLRASSQRDVGPLDRIRVAAQLGAWTSLPSQSQGCGQLTPRGVSRRPKAERDTPDLGGRRELRTRRSNEWNRWETGDIRVSLRAPRFPGGRAASTQA